MPKIRRSIGINCSRICTFVGLQYGGQYLLYGAWLGMFQNRDGSVWNWIHSGEEVAPFNWAPGEPTSAQYR